MLCARSMMVLHCLLSRWPAEGERRAPRGVQWLCGGPTLGSNGKCSNENAIMDNDLMEYDLFG